MNLKLFYFIMSLLLSLTVGCKSVLHHGIKRQHKESINCREYNAKLGSKSLLVWEINSSMKEFCKEGYIYQLTDSTGKVFLSTMLRCSKVANSASAPCDKPCKEGCSGEFVVEEKEDTVLYQISSSYDRIELYNYDNQWRIMPSDIDYCDYKVTQILKVAQGD